MNPNYFYLEYLFLKIYAVESIISLLQPLDLYFSSLALTLLPILAGGP